ncbi:MAG TPA: alpha/beta hydrolase [Dehalococcoidia bacterium]|jgi:pimeloyl-ACP methyl ester carboxylesterase|nr:alpha/beta hydrolase [Dehalococcoidia bacterium]
MPFYERGDVRIHYEEAGAGFPLLLIPGGGLNSSISVWSTSGPFDAMEEFKDSYRCITADLRNSNAGESSGPVATENAWDSYADDHLGLMDHLGIREFMVLGCCIGGPFILKLLQRAPERVVAAVLCQPSGFRPEAPDLFWEMNTTNWGPALCARRPDVTTQMVEAHLHSLYRVQPDFVFSVSRDFARSCQTPALVLPDDVPPHPFQVSMDIFKLLPNAEVSMYPWKQPQELIPAAVARIRTFLKQHEPAIATR